jgi:O-antigen ligase
MGDRLLAPSEAAPTTVVEPDAGPAPAPGWPPPVGPALELPTPLGWGVAIGAFLVICAVVPTQESAELPAKAAVLAILGAAGLPYLVVRAVGRGRFRRSAVETWAARAAVAFVVMAFVSAMASVRPVLAMVGLYNQFTGWLFLAATAGCWAIGTGLKKADRHLLESSLIAAAALNAGVVVLQELHPLDTVGLYSYSGVPNGLMGNPVFLGAVLAASIALLAPRFRERPALWCIPTVLVAVALGISGERLPAILAIAVALWELGATWLDHHRAAADRDPVSAARLVRAAGYLGVAVGGMLLGWVITRLKGSGGGGVISHFAGSTTQETFSQRFNAWSMALHAFVHRPLIGYGPGQFRGATTPYWPLSQERLEPNTYFSDAHSVVFELLTTVGLIGLALFVTWLVLAFWRRRGPLVLFAVVLLVMELAEPLHVAILPMAFLALGAALLSEGGRPAAEPSAGRGLGIATVVMAVLAAVPAVMLTVGDAALTRAVGQYGAAEDKAALSNAHLAEAMLSPWKDPAEILAQIYLYQSIADVPGSTAKALQWAQVAASRDPTNAPILVNWANYLYYANQVTKAGQVAAAAHAANPWYAPALNVLGTVAWAQGNKAAGRHWYRLSLLADPGQPGIRNILSGRCPVRLPGAKFNAKALVCGSS